MGCTEAKEVGQIGGVEDDFANEAKLLCDDRDTEVVELQFRCSNLRLDAIVGNSVKIVVSSSIAETNDTNLLGETEEIQASENLQFTKPIQIVYLLHKNQYVTFQLMSVEKKILIGSAQKFASEVLKSSQEFPVTLFNQTKQNVGELIICKEKLSKSRPYNIIALTIYGKLDVEKNLYCKVFSLQPRNNQSTPIYQTESIKFKINTETNWKIVRVREEKLLKDNKAETIMIQICELVKQKPITLIEKVFSLQALKSKKGNVIIIEKVGKIFIDECKFEERYSFHGYLMGGLNISMILALDFSSSNGFQDRPNSFHYYDKRNDRNNEYIRAISDVGNALAKLDQDNLIPVFGFGAQLPEMSRNISNYFALNGNIFNPEIEGIEKIIRVYKENTQALTFAEPTQLSPIIHYVCKMVQAYVEEGIKSRYFVFLILTDGDIIDFKNTIDEIVYASSLPLSIIIVGIGNRSNLSEMNYLDSKYQLLKNSRNESACRDIVHFVELSKLGKEPHILAEQTLEELPKQVCDYMHRINVTPQKIENLKERDFNFFKITQKNFLEKIEKNNLSKNLIPISNQGIPSIENQFYQDYQNPNFHNILQIGARKV